MPLTKIYLIWIFFKFFISSIYSKHHILLDGTKWRKTESIDPAILYKFLPGSTKTSSRERMLRRSPVNLWRISINWFGSESWKTLTCNFVKISFDVLFRNMNIFYDLILILNISLVFYTEYNRKLLCNVYHYMYYEAFL